MFGDNFCGQEGLKVYWVIGDRYVQFTLPTFVA